MATSNLVSINVVMLIMWIGGIFGIYMYLTNLITAARNADGNYFVNFLADIGVSATAGTITYLLAKALNLGEIYLVILAAIVAHLSARVAYQASMVDAYRDMLYERELAEKALEESSLEEASLVVKDVDHA